MYEERTVCEVISLVLSKISIRPNFHGLNLGTKRLGRNLVTYIRDDLNRS